MSAGWLLPLCTVVGAVFIAKWILTSLCSLLVFLRVTVSPYLQKRDLAAEYGGKWAVVTGSTDGIGKEYARQLAQRGMKIVLISRTMEKLEKVAQEIREEFGVETHIIKADFYHGQKIYEGIAEGLKDKDIGVLVNNVGYFGLPEKFLCVSKEEIWRFLNVNIGSVVAMTKLVLPQMLSRKCGAIINISSIYAHCPIPYSATYSATKAFVTHFSHALEVEYRASGITVHIVEPSVVSTNMTSFSSTMRTPTMIAPSAASCVSNALSSLGYKKTTPGTWNHMLQTFVLKRCNRELAMHGFLKLYEALPVDGKKTQ